MKKRLRIPEKPCRDVACNVSTIRKKGYKMQKLVNLGEFPKIVIGGQRRYSLKYLFYQGCLILAIANWIKGASLAPLQINE
jgi:hypothetical protein